MKATIVLDIDQYGNITDFAVKHGKKHLENVQAISLMVDIRDGKQDYTINFSSREEHPKPPAGFRP